MAQTFNPTPKAVRRIVSLDDHRALISDVFKTAKERIVIVSPFISISALKADDIPGKIRGSIRRGVSVRIYIDDQLNIDSSTGAFKQSAQEGICSLLNAGASVEILIGVHNKTMICDNCLIAEGSFNWLSAVRSVGGLHQREERTLVVEGGEAQEMIKEEIGMLSTNQSARSISLVSKKVPLLGKIVSFIKLTPAIVALLFLPFVSYFLGWQFGVAIFLILYLPAFLTIKNNTQDLDTIVNPGFSFLPYNIHHK